MFISSTIGIVCKVNTQSVRAEMTVKKKVAHLLRQTTIKPCILLTVIFAAYVFFYVFSLVTDLPMPIVLWWRYQTLLYSSSERSG